MRSRLVLLALLLAAAAAWMAWLAVYQVDDAYIVYRYAQNIARGQGFVFNPGERVEGVTCFLWTLLLVPVATGGFSLPRAAPFLTASCGLAVLALVPGLAARCDGRSRWESRDLLPALFTAAHPGFAYWSVGALETVPYTLLLVLAVRSHLDEREGTGIRAAWWMAAAALVRPEAPLVAAALVADRLGRWRAALRWVALFAAVFGAFLVFRRAYFGDWLPNTYYAKSGAGLVQQAGAAWSYTSGYVWESLLAPLGPPRASVAAVVFALYAGLVVQGLLRPTTRPAALVVAAITAAVFFEGGDWMVLYRFYVPTVPFLAILLTRAGRAAISGLPAGRTRAAAWGIATALVVLTWGMWGIRSRDGGQGLRVNAAGYDFAHREIARLLRERARPGDTVALMDVGIIGYESGLGVLDVSGLVTRETAHAPGGFLEKAYPPETILAHRPRFIVLVPGYPIDRRIALSPAFQASYRLVTIRNHRFNWNPPSSYDMHMFERVVGGGG